MFWDVGTVVAYAKIKLMKNKWWRVGSLVSAMALIVGLSGSLVMAQDADHMESTETTQTEQTDRKALQDRLAQRKNQLKTRLTAAQTTRLKDRCKPAQAKLNTFHGKLRSIERSRVNAYDKIIDHLNALVSKVGDKADTSDLQAQINTLKEKVEAFENDFTAYRQIVSDLHEMDCGADPAAFKASLESAKSLQSQLKTEAKDIRAYITETIKPTITALRQTLNNKQAGEVIN